jgi:hypothetical protein
MEVPTQKQHDYVNKGIKIFVQEKQWSRDGNGLQLPREMGINNCHCRLAHPK